MQFLALRLIDFYQIFLSPQRGLLMAIAPGMPCKYPVTCSEYMKIKIKEEGIMTGVVMGIRRIISCR